MENKKQIKEVIQDLRGLNAKINGIINNLDTTPESADDENWLYADSLTFNEWYEYWITMYKTDLKENTLKSIKSVFKNYILPKIGKKTLNSIKTHDIQEIINSLKEKPRQQTVLYIQLNSCLKQAFHLNLISNNPCYACKIKKFFGQRGKALNHYQQKKLIRYIKLNPAPINNLILLYMYTGMRCSELLNIKQSDVNRRKYEIHICGTKTINSDRVIQTTPQIIELIPRQPFFPFEEWNKSKLAGAFKRLAKKLRFEKITIHSLRHTFATNCVENGVDMVVLQKWLGHSSIQMTIDRYTHVSDSYQRKQRNKLKQDIFDI